VNVRKVKPTLNSPSIPPRFGPIGQVFGLSPTPQTHTYLNPLQKSLRTIHKFDNANITSNWMVFLAKPW